MLQTIIYNIRQEHEERKKSLCISKVKITR